jgi:hypothetical protein
LGNYHSPSSYGQTEPELIYYSCSGAVRWIVDWVQGSMPRETHQSSHRAHILNSRKLAVGPRMLSARRMWRFWNLHYLLGSPAFTEPSTQQGQIWLKGRIYVKFSHCSYYTKLLCTSHRMVSNPRK